MASRTLSDRFHKLLRAGQIYFIEGDFKQAHICWRKAALLDPTNEKVWLSLLQVLTEETDRVICLQNILLINPENQSAKQELQTMMPTPPEIEFTRMQPAQRESSITGITTELPSYHQYVGNIPSWRQDWVVSLFMGVMVLALVTAVVIALLSLYTYI